MRATPRRHARIVALGGAAPPPPPENPDEQPPSPEDAAANVGDESASPDNDVDSSGEVTADDILNSPTFLKKKLELVQKELIGAKEKVDKADEAIQEEKDKYVRLAADFENYRRRSVEDLRLQDVKSTAKVCRELMGVLDNFERATAAVNAQTDEERSIVSSYTAINKQLLESLEKLGVESIDSIGQVFDPEFHEAIQKLESDKFEEDVVCEQYQRGYKIGDSLIRAAIVGVSVGPGPNEPGRADDNGAASEETTDAEQNAESVQAAEGL